MKKKLLRFLSNNIKKKRGIVSSDKIEETYEEKQQSDNETEFFEKQAINSNTYEPIYSREVNY
jgi:hypothetical protein